MEIKKIIEGMTAPEVAKIIDDNFNAINQENALVSNAVNSNRYGFNVTVNGLRGGVHSLETAIKDVPASQRMSGQKITFDTGAGWVTYQFENLAISEFEKESEWKQISGIKQVSGDINITNKADEEDITSSADGVLRLADKEHVADSFSGLGRKYLRKNIQTVTNEAGEPVIINRLTQDMLSLGSTRYVIQYDYDLNGAEITIPAGCVLDFQGGSFSNGTIIGESTKIHTAICRIFSTDISIIGSWYVSMAYPEWFGAVGDGNKDDSDAINKCIEAFSNNKTSIFLSREYAVSNIYVKKTSRIIGSPRTIIHHIGEGVCIDVAPPEEIDSWHQFVRTRIFDLVIYLNEKSTIGLRINQCTGSIFERIFIYGVNSSVPIIDSSESPESFSNIKSRGVFMDGTSNVVDNKNSIFNNILNRIVANNVDIGFDIDGIISDSKFYNIECNIVGEGIRIKTMGSHNVTLMDSQFVETNIAINMPATNTNLLITGCNIELYRYYGIYKGAWPNSCIINVIKNGATTKYDTKISDFLLNSIVSSQISNNLVGWGSNKPEDEKTPSEKSNIDGDFVGCLVYGNKPSVGSSVQYSAKAINMNFMFKYSWFNDSDCTEILGNTLFKDLILDKIKLVNDEHSVELSLKSDRCVSVKNASGTEAFIPYGATNTDVAKDAIVGTMIYRTDYDRPIWRNSNWQWREIDGCIAGTLRVGTTEQRPKENWNALVIGFVYFDTTLNKPIWHKGEDKWVDATGAEV